MFGIIQSPSRCWWDKVYLLVMKVIFLHKDFISWILQQNHTVNLVPKDTKYRHGLMRRVSTRGLTVGNCTSCPRSRGQHYQVFPDLSRGRGEGECLHRGFQQHSGAVGTHSRQSRRLDVGARVPIQGKTRGTVPPFGWAGRQTTKSRPFGSCRNGKVGGSALRLSISGIGEKKTSALFLMLFTLQMNEQEWNSQTGLWTTVWGIHDQARLKTSVCVPSSFSSSGFSVVQPENPNYAPILLNWLIYFRFTLDPFHTIDISIYFVLFWSANFIAVDQFKIILRRIS